MSDDCRFDLFHARRDNFRLCKAASRRAHGRRANDVWMQAVTLAAARLRLDATPAITALKGDLETIASYAKIEETEMWNETSLSRTFGSSLILSFKARSAAAFRPLHSWHQYPTRER